MFAATLCCYNRVLIALGVDAAWENRLASLEPLQPIFLVFAAGYISFAFYDLYVFPRNRPPALKRASAVLQRRRLAFWICAAAMLAMLAVASFGGPIA